jgi:hypothetical protein
MGKRSFSLLACLLFLAAWSVPRAYGDGLKNRNGIKRVLLISIDGFHALDYLNCKNGISTINNGQPYCTSLAALGTSGINYLQTSTSTPSDSFPGLMALVTGGSPRTMGVSYDVAYDRALSPPINTTGNGLLGTGVAGCTPGSPTGTSTEYEEGININLGLPPVPPGQATTQAYLNGGAPSGDGGVNSIEPTRLERDNNCNPVYPWNFVRVNTIFGVIHGTGGYTAWADKHPAYSSVGGPSAGTTDTNVDDYFGPEINSVSSDYTDPKTGAFPGLVPSFCKNAQGQPELPDQISVAAGDDYTGSFQNIQCYDGIKVNAILNEIDGLNHDGTAQTGVPNIFGMNFQAVSVGQKLIYKDGAVAPGYSTKGGYIDSIGTPSDSLLKEIEFVDTSIGMMVSELQKQRLYKSTLIIITAKHGQSPVDSSRYVPNGPDNDPASILDSCLPASESQSGGQIGPTQDDVSLLWLLSSCNVATEVSALESASPAALPGDANKNIAGIGEIYSGPSMALWYNPGDSRAPDILVTPNIGVTYSNSGKKLAEHGGFAHDDVNVILLVSNPSFTSNTITTQVQTKQVAPTILTALGLDPSSLQAVVKEGTQILPGLSFKTNTED